MNDGGLQHYQQLQQWEEYVSENHFVKLASIDVSKHIEKKQNLSYLSWAWAVDQLFRADPGANWQFHAPQMFGETMMVSCTVTAFGKAITMHLPVMDHRNQAVKNPDAFVINKNMMRCLVKAIACHGLGLYIYAGEDLPADHEAHADEPKKPAQAAPAKPFDLAAACDWISKAHTIEEAKLRARKATDRAENDGQRKAIRQAFTDYEQAAMASA